MNAVVQRMVTSLDSFPLAAIPLIVLGGIYGGLFTPTEAAIVAVFYAFALGRFVYRGLSNAALYKAFSEALINTVAILLIISAANLFGWMLTINQIPRMVTEMFLSVSHDPVVFLLAVNALLLVVGMFLEIGASTIIMAPMLTPAALAFGISPLHFGIVMTLNLAAIGMTTPPVGVNLFVACQVAGLRIEQILKSMLPSISCCCWTWRSSPTCRAVDGPAGDAALAGGGAPRAAHGRIPLPTRSFIGGSEPCCSTATRSKPSASRRCRRTSVSAKAFSAPSATS